MNLDILKKPKENLIIDVDLIIKRFNARFPTLAEIDPEELKDMPADKLNKIVQRKKLDRDALAEILDCNKQLFVSYKMGKTPKLIYILYALMELGECGLSDFIVPAEPKAKKAKKVTNNK